MTRGMFVTVLGRYAGIDPERYDNWYLPHLYTDVDSEQYYAPYINWATRYGITTGMGEGIFGPDQPINREQMATFFVRFADNFGYRFTTIVEEVAEGFADAQTVSGYAVDAVERMRTCGLLTGRPNEDGTFDLDPRPWPPVRNARRCSTVCANPWWRMKGSGLWSPMTLNWPRWKPHWLLAIR